MIIYLRPRDLQVVDYELRKVMDDEGWFPLKSTGGLRKGDFRRCQIKINDVIYDEPSPEFWEEYEKAFAWLKLQHT